MEDITTLYYYSLVALFVVTSLFGLLFLTQFNNQDREIMRSYRIAKKLLAVAFFCVAIGNLVELFDSSEKMVEVTTQDILLSQTIALSISVSQAFILTLVCVLLIDPKSINSKHLKWQIIAVVSYILTIVAGYLSLPQSAVANSVFLFSFSVLYCVALVYFTAFFVHRYHSFRKMMDNFYSDDVAARMHWIAIAFYTALGIGVFALISIQHVNYGLNIVFNIFSLCFYTFLGIKILNYPWQFEMIELSMTEEPISYEETAPPHKSIELWIAEKHFLKSGVTIDDLAKFLETNRTYLSSYFNAKKGITFRQWINLLRIEEAKRIIATTPKITMAELASRLGYADTSTFFRHFKAIEGIQPSVWKQTNLPI